MLSSTKTLGLILGISLASNLAAGFAPNQKVRSTLISSVHVVGSVSNDEWFYEEKKTLYSEQETERSKRKYTMEPGAKTQVFQNKYPSSSEKPASAIKPSPYIPLAFTTDKNWFNHESVLTYDATYRQRGIPNTASAATNKPATKTEVDEKGQRASTGSSPYQPAVYSTQTATQSVPVAYTAVPESTKPLERAVELRPEDIVTTEGRWFNTESMVSYGRKTRDRNYQGIKTYKDDDDEYDFLKQLSPRRIPSEPSSFVDVADTSTVAPQNTASKPQRGSMDIATTLPFKTRPKNIEEQKAETKVENETTSKSDDDKTKEVETTVSDVATMTADAIAVTTTAPDAETATVPDAESALTPTIQEPHDPTVTAERAAALAASITSTDDRWFNSEQRDYLRPVQKHMPYTIRNPEYHWHPNMIRARAKASVEGRAAGAEVADKAKTAEAETTASEGAFVPVNYTPIVPTSSTPSPPGADTSLAATTNKSQAEEEFAQPMPMPLAATTDQGWFNNEKRPSYESHNTRREHIPYRLIPKGMDEASMRTSGLS